LARKPQVDHVNHAPQRARCQRDTQRPSRNTRLDGRTRRRPSSRDNYGRNRKGFETKKDTGPLTRTDIEKIVNEARNGKGKRGWEPWMYVALGGGLAFGSNVFVELVRVVAG